MNPSVVKPRPFWNSCEFDNGDRPLIDPNDEKPSESDEGFGRTEDRGFDSTDENSPEEDLDDGDDDLDMEDIDESSPEEVDPPPIPWNPPAGVSFEEEWLTPAPRSFDKKAFQGTYELDQKLKVGFSLITGAMFIGASFLPGIQNASLYLPVLSWLMGLGVAFVLLGAIIQWKSGGVTGPYQYLRDGVPMLVRIRRMQTIRDGSGENDRFRYKILFDYPDPLTGELILWSSDSKEMNNETFQETELSYRVGEYVTAVYLPEAKDSTLTLYGLLGLRKDLGLINRVERSPRFATEAKLGCAIIWGIVGILLWGVFVVFRYWPIEIDWVGLSPWFFGGGLGLGLPLQVWQYLSQRRRISRERESAASLGKDLPKRSAAGSLVGLPFTVVLYGLLGSVVGLTCNALLDRSKGDRKEIVIDRLYERVDKILIFPMLRDYRIEYHFVDEARHRWHLSTPEEMKILKQGSATAIVREGQQGWPWVDRIVPVVDK
jgi:hypothetical protein